MRWFKDFCAVMGFVTEFHPWWIDWAARQNIKWVEEQIDARELEKLVKKRISEYQQAKEEQTHD